MKVLQFIDSLSAGGAEKLLVNSVIKYREMGIDVDILLLKGGESPFLGILECNPEIKVFSFGEKNNVYSPLNILKVYRFLKNYDIIHVHLFPSLYWAAFADIIKIKKNYKLVFTEHNTTNRRRSKAIFKIIDKLVYSRYNKIITISDSVDVNLKSHLGNSFNSKFIKIYNGIDLKEINEAIPYSKKDIGFKDDNKLLLQVSSFTPQKNQLTLIKSLKYLPENYHLILVGDGELKAECIKITKDLELSNRVSFYGIRKDVPRLLKSVDIVVLSSHFEGLSLSSVEGLASGKPFIASNVPGLTEVVEGAGVLFEDNNEKELSKCINELIEDDEYRNRIVKKCIDRSKKFDIINMTTEYSNLYRDLI